MLKLMKDRPIIIICGDPESTFNEILSKTLNDKTLGKMLEMSDINFCSDSVMSSDPAGTNRVKVVHAYLLSLKYQFGWQNCYKMYLFYFI